MSSKEDALVEVVDIIKRHNLSLADISSALEGGNDFKARTSSSILRVCLVTSEESSSSSASRFTSACGGTTSTRRGASF
jgi:hypothetical protein